VLFFAGVLWIGVDRLVMADDAPKLQPIPAQTPSVQPTQSPVPGQSPLLSSDEPCPDLCDFQVCSPPGRFWLRADYLMWWTKGITLPPLVTTSPAGTPLSQAGVLGQPGTTILYGGDTVNQGGRSGARVTMGCWLDACHIWGVEFDYLNLGGQSSNFSASSTNGSTILARPYYELNPTVYATGGQAAEMVSGSFTAGTGNVVYTGGISVQVKDYFQSAGVLFSYKLCNCDCECCENPCPTNCCDVPRLNCCRTDLLAGFRYYGLNDSVGIHETPTETSAAGTWAWDIHDNFSAKNDFYGSEVGLRTKIYRGRWSLDIMSKVAIGNNHQTVTIDGSTVVTTGGKTLSAPTGIFTNSLVPGANAYSSPYSSDNFTMIPELNLELGYQINTHWRAYVGYDVMYWACVVRAADQIDLNLDSRNFYAGTSESGYPFPQFSGRTNSFWAQGINLGTEFRF
jgi:hypothetical protein